MIAPVQDGPIPYYDEYGNEISEAGAMLREPKDRIGTVFCEHYERNENVSALRYNSQNGTVLPITVCTYNSL